MSGPDHRRAANRLNAQKSSGPITPEGKVVASQNALRHGLLSTKLLLDDEDPKEYDALLRGLAKSLGPVGALEAHLVERIAVTLWRQRRLVHAETAGLSLGRKARHTAALVSSELGRRYDRELQPQELSPFDDEHAAWCRAVISEIEELADVSLPSVESQAPLVFEQLQSDMAEAEQAPDAFVASHKGGLTGYLAELLLWCRGSLVEAGERPHVLELAKHVMAKRLVLPADTLELMARYQSTLDNQLYKALRALRDTQEWRLKTLDGADITPDREEAHATA